MGSTYAIGDDPRLRQLLGELRSVIVLAETAPWTPVEARGIVEALRLGVPPAGAAAALTVGREGVLVRMARDLKYVGDGKSRLVFLRAEYGMGKTHILRVMQEYGRQHAFASSLVELSQRECPLHDLRLVYRNVVRNLQTASETAAPGVEELLEEWAERIRALAERDRRGALRRLRGLHRDFRGALTTYFSGQRTGRTELSQLVVEWLTGGSLSARERAWLGVSENVSEKNALTMLGNVASMLRIVGMRGMIIFLDEADATLSFEGPGHGARAARNLNVLLQCSGTFPCSYFVYSTPPSFFRRFDVVSSITLDHDSVVELGTLEPAELLALAQKIRDLHLRAYVWQNTSRVRDSTIGRLVDRLLEDDAVRSSVRGFVRAIVDVLDCCQGDPSLSLMATLSGGHTPGGASAH